MNLKFQICLQCYLNKNIFFCSDGKQEGYLVEAKLIVHENWLQRGSWLSYQYGVTQRRKEMPVTELALRNIQIPSNQNIKGKTR